MRRVLGVTIVLALFLLVSSVARAQLVLSLTSAGAGSVTIPPGYDWTNVTVQCWGGGGGGGVGPATNGVGGGGGGGAYSSKTYTMALVAGGYSWYVGAGGAGITSFGATAGSGANTIWNYGGVQDVIAGGGGAGGMGNNDGGGVGGSGGTVLAGMGYSGGNGGAGDWPDGVNGGGGGGGGAGGPSGPGGQGGTGAYRSGGSGGTGSVPGGSGGNGNGFPGGFPGGGGGGGQGGSGPGGNGEIVVTYTPVYCGNVAWSASGGGSWGTLTSNLGTNWGGAGYGSPGLSPSYPDSATLSGSVMSGVANVTLDGASPSLAALTFSNSTASYVIAAGSGGTIQLNGGTAAAAVTDSAGSHSISAPISLVTGANLTVTNPGDTLAISGPIGGNGGLTTTGAGTLVLAASNSYTGGTTISAGTLALGNGGTTGSVLGGITNNATLLLNFSGNQPFSNSVSGSGNVVVSGPGTVTLQVPLAPTQTSVNEGQLVVASGASLSGNLVIGSSGYCSNNGNMNGLYNLTNAGIFVGSAQVSGSFSNAPNGTVRVPSGQTVFLQAAVPQTNAGLIQVLGIQTAQSQFESYGPFTNKEGGLIAAQNANLYFDGGLTNQASVAFSYGVSNLSGAVVNSASGTISVNGGAGVTFYGNVEQDGTLAVNAVGSTHSSAVFLGTFSGSGGFTGGGDVFFEGGLQPSDPVAVTFGGNAYLANSTDTVMQLAGPTAGSQYDKITVTGQLVLAGRSMSNSWTDSSRRRASPSSYSTESFLGRSVRLLCHP